MEGCKDGFKLNDNKNIRGDYECLIFSGILLLLRGGYCLFIICIIRRVRWISSMYILKNECWYRSIKVRCWKFN